MRTRRVWLGERTLVAARDAPRQRGFLYCDWIYSKITPDESKKGVAGAGDFKSSERNEMRLRISILRIDFRMHLAGKDNSVSLLRCLVVGVRVSLGITCLEPNVLFSICRSICQFALYSFFGVIFSFFSVSLGVTS